jgi:hypothetical protein
VRVGSELQFPEREEYGILYFSSTCSLSRRVVVVMIPLAVKFIYVPCYAIFNFAALEVKYVSSGVLHKSVYERAERKD